MEYRIVTNNPLVRDKYDKAYYIKGTFEEILIKVRDLIYEGVDLISSPLGASGRMLYSPYRSVIVGQKKKCIDPLQINIIENSIINYRKSIKNRKIDWKHANDYSLIDNELLISTIKQLEFDY